MVLSILHKEFKKKSYIEDGKTFKSKFKSFIKFLLIVSILPIYLVFKIFNPFSLIKKIFRGEFKKLFLI